MDDQENLSSSKLNVGSKSGIPTTKLGFELAPAQVAMERLSVKLANESSSTSKHQRGVFEPKLTFRHWRGRIFSLLLIASVILAVSLLFTLLVEVAIKGAVWLDYQFLTSFPSRFPARAGLYSALMGTLWVISFTALFAIPIGVGAAIFLEEYSRSNRWTTIIEVNLANLAGVPSIIYGLLGLVVFVRTIGMGRSIVSGAATLALLVLPVIIVASREALKQVPNSIREAAYALGATKWQTISAHVLPAAAPGIVTGVILALSRAIGETAPLIMVGAVAYIAFVPESPMSSFTVLPIQIYDWTSRPQESFHELAAAGIIVLLVVLLTMNAIAVFIRNHYQRKRPW